MPGISGIIYGNFGVERYPGVKCAGVRHAACYTKHWDDIFPIMQKDNLDDLPMRVNELEPDNPHRFQVARNGDHMMVPFQCDLCHFMNIQKLVPLD